MSVSRWVTAIALWLMPSAALAQAIVAASPDVTVGLGASPVVAMDHDVAIDDQQGGVALEDLGALPARADVIGLGLDVNGDRLVAVDTVISLPGGVIARPGDVVRYDGASYSIEFDAAAAGVPASARTDAVSLAAGGLLLSFDTTVSLGEGILAADEDLVVWDGAYFNWVFIGSSQGLDARLDIDAAQDLGDGSYLMSFDTAGEIAGIAFDDEDVLRFDGSTWSLEVDGSAMDPAWQSADLEAVVVPEPASLLGLAAGGFLLAALARQRSRDRDRGQRFSSLGFRPRVR